MDFNSIESIVDGLDKILDLSSAGGPPPVPPPLILAGVNRRPGLSAIKIANRIIARKSEAGLPVGTLASGNVSPDEIMEQIRIEEIVKAIHEELMLTVVIPPGISLTAAGISPAGPVTVNGMTTTLSKGYGIIQ